MSKKSGNNGERHISLNKIAFWLLVAAAVIYFPP